MKIATLELNLIHRPFWNVATWIGTRRLGQLLKDNYSSAYGDTLFYLDEDSAPAATIALTIDDGLSRGGLGSSMVSEIRDLLQEYNARATFFVCTDYCVGQEEAVAALLNDGHEIGNHLSEDLSFHYSRLSMEEFRDELVKTSQILDEWDGGSKKRWFRAPQGLMNAEMCQVLREEGLQNVLGDCYCDDWRFAEASNAAAVAPIMLRQVREGSIAIFHMPEKGFREEALQGIKDFLEGLKAKGWRCTTLTDLTNMSKT